MKVIALISEKSNVKVTITLQWILNHLKLLAILPHTFSWSKCGLSMRDWLTSIKLEFTQARIVCVEPSEHVTRHNGDSSWSHWAPCRRKTVLHDIIKYMVFWWWQYHGTFQDSIISTWKLCIARSNIYPLSLARNFVLQTVCFVINFIVNLCDYFFLWQDRMCFS